MSRPSLEFWYEFASPYSYLSALRIGELADKHGFDIKWKPFLLGAIFKSQGMADTPAKLFPAKGNYMWMDVARTAKKYGWRFQKPTVFPAFALQAARIAILSEGQEWEKSFCEQVFQAYFEKDLDIGQDNVIQDILTSLGLDAQDVWQQANSDDNKNKLKAQTQSAIDLGLFGAPTFMVGEEMFWGDDRLEQAIEYLLGQ
ncbi:2-hydroxychromene-2-carboxylate isomerase [Paraneptunicella aestuarii]|uniref:2-hydroxychromene-2-carboxylate isomerase n=1 Tax=Paraneptunicella aestuarii TaxID=2831148 RepID=UPI001E36A81C|nr:2-hydroxychromene-2-carboxylate isomerase [Paraneptunicella aestuarii]UAA39244.1 2-hydroxychromene-2-carboxylate isomerase [Paraneptunicella aestuarii]